MLKAPDAPPPSARAEVTPAKLKALHEAIAQGLVVTFRNGARIRKAKNNYRGVEVNRWPGRIAQMERSFGMRDLEAAYDYALNGATEEERARRPRGKPFWFNPDKLRPDRPEWDDCPF